MWCPLGRCSVRVLNKASSAYMMQQQKVSFYTSGKSSPEENEESNPSQRRDEGSSSFSGFKKSKQHKGGEKSLDSYLASYCPISFCS